MKIGECVLFYISYNFVYGKEGSFFFFNVFFMVDVLYEVEFIGY